LPAELLALGPVLTPNEPEATALSGEADPEAAARALTARTGAPVVVTIGPEGALLADGDALERIPAPRVEAVDTTGAGDAFNGALAAALAGGAELAEAVRTAISAAADSVTRPGARG
jgi:ribokinase